MNLEDNPNSYISESGNKARMSINSLIKRRFGKSTLMYNSKQE